MAKFRLRPFNGGVEYSCWSSAVAEKPRNASCHWLLYP